MRHKLMLTLVSIAMAALAGCGAAPMPAERMAASEASIRAADEVGARSVPAAALYLQLAREEVERARQLVKSDQPDRAKLVLLRAEADAELALALARAATMQGEAQQAVAKVRRLQQEAGAGH